jgi:hypothetical protein
MSYPTLSTTLGKDSGGHYFIGPNGRVPKGFTDPDNNDEATEYIVLVGPDGETPIVTSTGIKIAAGQTIGISGTVPVSGPIAISGTVPVSKAVADLVAAAPASGTVGATSGSLVSANPNRKGLVIINLSANTISFGLDGNAAVLNSGITLKVNQNWVMDEYTFTNTRLLLVLSPQLLAVRVVQFLYRSSHNANRRTPWGIVW